MFYLNKDLFFGLSFNFKKKSWHGSVGMSDHENV